jgi:hypothetical protein
LYCKLHYFCKVKRKYFYDDPKKNLSALESLQVITEAISKTKEDFKENSSYFMLWGWLIALASFSFFVLHQYTAFQYYFLPFPVLVAAGIITTLTWFFKRKSAHPTEGYLNYFLGRMWLVVGISFIIAVFVAVSEKLPPFLYTSIIAAIGTLISGLAMRFNPLITGGVLFFIAAVIGIYIPAAYQPVLFGMAVIAGYLIPGYLLKSAKI